MVENEVITRTMYLLTEIVRKICRSPESVFVQVDGKDEDGTVVLLVHAEPSDLETIHRNNPRMVRSLEQITSVLSTREGLSMRLSFAGEASH